MTTKEAILLKIMEECAEIQQAVSKVLRFGPDSKSHAGWPGTNLEHLSDEIVDFCAALAIAMDEGIIPPDQDHLHRVDEKMKKIEKYLRVSRDLGIITDHK